MGGHDVKLPDIPDWRIYRVEDVPELMKVKKDLERRGLRNPWLRNEVWKYSNNPLERSLFQALKFVFGGGFKYGLAAAVVTIFAEKAYMSYMAGPGEDHH